MLLLMSKIQNMKLLELWEEFLKSKIKHLFIQNIIINKWNSVNWAISHMIKGLTNDLGDWGSIPGLVIPKTQKNVT